MSDSPKNELQTKENENAKYAGAGGGTLLAVVASQLDDGNPIKPWLICAIPALSVVFGAIWIWLQVKIINIVRDNEAHKISVRTTRLIEEALANQNTSEDHKKMLRSRLEQFQMQNVDRSLKKLQNADVFSVNDIK